MLDESSWAFDIGRQPPLDSRAAYLEDNLDMLDEPPVALDLFMVAAPKQLTAAFRGLCSSGDPPSVFRTGVPAWSQPTLPDRTAPARDTQCSCQSETLTK